MISARTLFALAVLAAASAPALAQDTTATPPEAAPAAAPAMPPAAVADMTLTLSSATDIERTVAIYQCDNGEGFRVQYINAAPNFLALVPVEGEVHVFVTTVSASGARYVSGPYEWWTQGDDARLSDLQAEEDAPPLATCLAASNTP